jgi:hypothetical protein
LCERAELVVAVFSSKNGVKSGRIERSKGGFDLHCVFWCEIETSISTPSKFNLNEVSINYFL